jgi:Flp pilus assembly protein TadG
VTSQSPSLRSLFGRAASRGRAFARDEQGVTVIEFAILALPFFTVIFAILETAIVFLSMQVLDSAVEDASRLIKTGRAQTAGYDMADFREVMCGYTFDLFGDCSKIKIQIKEISDFASVQTTPPVTCTPAVNPTTCDITMTEDYSPSDGGKIVQVQVYYRWPLVLALPYFNMKNQPDNYRLIGATRVFRNEPFTLSE